MCARLCLLTLIASAGVCSGHFFSDSLLTRLQGFGFRPAASSSTFMSSVSFKEGSDGEMHKRVHQLSTEKMQDGATVKRSQTEWLCADGDCHKKTLRGSSAWVPSNDGSWHKEVHREHKETHRVDDILQHQSHSSMDCIDGVCRHQASRISRLSHAAGMMLPKRLQAILERAMGTRINPVIGPALPAPMEVPDTQAAHVVHPVPLLRRVVPLSWRRAAPLMVVRTKEPTDLQAVAPPVQEGQPLDDLFSLYILSVAVFSTALTAAALLKFFGRRSEARELPLGEPLFPHAGVAAARMNPAARLPTVFEEKTVPGATTDLAAAQDYLPRLYQKASSLADARLVRAYLTRVYAAQA